MRLKVGEIVLIAAELALLGYVLVKARLLLRVFRREYGPSGDFLASLRRANAEVTGGKRVVEIILFELAMLHYALWAWGPPRPAAGEPFTAFKKSGYGQLLAGLGMIAAMEVALVHWLLHRYWSPLAAWVLTGLSLYGCLFFLADWKACRRRPILLGNAAILVRIGLRWDVRIPFAAIAAFRPAARFETAQGPHQLKAALRGNPDFVFELKEKVEAVGAYGRRREVARVFLAVDDRAVFAALLESRLPKNS